MRQRSVQLHEISAQVFEQDARDPVPCRLSVLQDRLLPLIKAGGRHGVSRNRLV